MLGLVIAVSLALPGSVLATRTLVHVLNRQSKHQPINPDLPHHAGRAGTPTMGGVAFLTTAIAATLLGVIGSRSILTWQLAVAVAATLGAALVGLADDLAKIRRRANGGLTQRQKMIGVVVVGVTVGTACVLAETGDLIFIPFRSSPLRLAPPLVILLAVALVAAVTNAVNLTDGLDGLAGGASAVTFAALAVIGYWIFRHPIYGIQGALGLAALAAALGAACAGFLWWNTHPASVFMGDVGALGLGAALATISMLLGMAAYLPLLGALFLVETCSVIVLVTAFRVFGRRPFRAPMHHHFEDPQHPEKEPTLVMRLWLFHGCCVAITLAVFYGSWLSTQG